MSRVARRRPMRPLVAALFAAALAACAPSRSFERASDGSVVYLDELSPPARADARRRIVQSLKRGIEVYDFGVGDEIEVFFHVEQRPTRQAYALSIGDELNVRFLRDPDSDLTLKIRPDGRISLPLLGPVMAAGRTADELATELEARYKGLLERPEITINVSDFELPLDDFTRVVGSSGTGRSLVVKVLPDGTVALPLLPPLKADGRTLTDLQDEIDAAYSALGYAVFVSLIPKQLRVGATLVLGEVEKPGRYDLERPQTVLMAVGRAGGVLRTGAADAVRLFYIGEDGQPRVRSVNLSHILQDLRLEEDMIVPDNSVIYVPPTELAKAGRLMDAVVKDILRFNGFTFGFSYQLNDNANVNAP